MTANEARSLFSEYIDGSLDAQRKDELQAFLIANPETAAEFIQFERTLSLVHRLSQQDPVLDMWSEFAPKMSAYLAEQKQDPVARLRHNWADLRSSVSEGIILWTHALAARSRAALGKYLLREPLQDLENE